MDEQEVIELGATVQDTLSDFTGVVIGRAEYLYGCVRVAVQGGELKDGIPVEEEWFDEERMEVIPAEVHDGNSDPTGGPRREVGRIRALDPT